MKEELLNHLNDARQLEKMYRTDKASFTTDFRSLYSEVRGNPIADAWNERLNYENEDISWGTGSDLTR